MGILVICSYRPHPGHEDEARMLMAAMCRCCAAWPDHRPAVVQGVAKDGELVEIFEWESWKNPRRARHCRDRRALEGDERSDGFRAAGAAGGSQHAFAHFNPI